MNFESKRQLVVRPLIGTVGFWKRKNSQSLLICFPRTSASCIAEVALVENIIGSFALPGCKRVLSGVEKDQLVGPTTTEHQVVAGNRFRRKISIFKIMYRKLEVARPNMNIFPAGVGVYIVYTIHKVHAERVVSTRTYVLKWWSWLHFWICEFDSIFFRKSEPDRRCQVYTGLDGSQASFTQPLAPSESQGAPYGR